VFRFNELQSLASGAEHRQRRCEDVVLRRIFGPKEEKVRRGWRKLLKEMIDNLCVSPTGIVEYQGG
jgi:hypothetical protein